MHRLYCKRFFIFFIPEKRTSYVHTQLGISAVWVKISLSLGYSERRTDTHVSEFYMTLMSTGIQLTSKPSVTFVVLKYIVLFRGWYPLCGSSTQIYNKEIPAARLSLTAPRLMRIKTHLQLTRDTSKRKTIHIHQTKNF